MKHAMIFLVFFLMALSPVAASGAIDSLSYPQHYFRAPLDIPLTLAGNFGEPRGTHFHTGLDFKTNGVTGLPVYAAADGYIIRINVSPYGYGNALYIRHPNGWVTVYGHLSKFNNQITERLRKEQYAQQSFSVYFTLKADEIPVKKGEIIAWSGNTGGSGGPHLHFEIRDTSDNVFNPLLFGIPINDRVKPTATFLELYALDDSLKGRSNHYRIKLFNEGGYHEPKNSLIRVNMPLVGFSVNTLDRMTGSDNTIGIYNITVFDNDKMIYEYRQDELNFTVTRCVLSHVDYSILQREKGQYYHKCFVLPGDECTVYSNLLNRGVINLNDGQKHKIWLEIQDYTGNTTVVRFTLLQDRSSGIFHNDHIPYLVKFAYDRPNEFTTTDIQLNFPKGCLFDDMYFNYAMDTSHSNTIYSNLHQVGNTDIPLFHKYEIAIKAEHLPTDLESKALLACRDAKGNVSYVNGDYKDGFVESKVREFGRYYVVIDTTPPKIIPINISEGKNMRKWKKIMLRISDNISGIDHYDTYLDGQWTVTDYDAKNALLTHTISPELAPGSHVFKVVIFDGKQNSSTYSVKFNW